MTKAFSLTELLVSITLIVIMAALLFPVFTQAKDKGKQTVCISNLRQVYAALKLYQADYEEYPPGSSFGEPAFRTYYKTLLRCYSSTQQFAEYDYYALWSGLGQPLLPTEVPIQEAFLLCRSLRGAEFPLVLDLNHRIATDNPLVIVLREAGSVKSRPASKAPLTSPCQGTPLSRFWNY